VTERIRLILVALALSLLGGACGSSATKQTTATKASSAAAVWRLPDLEHPGRSVNLVTLFNRGTGTPRLILLISPT
jgi:hypothetical protein